MDDLEITRLCARAAEYDPAERNGRVRVGIWGDIIYDPLHNRGQALELVERLHLSIEYHAALRKWSAAQQVLPQCSTFEPNLLRAICLCAARVQQARESTK